MNEKEIVEQFAINNEGNRFDPGPHISSCSDAYNTKWVRFTDMTDDELKDLLNWHTEGLTRKQLLAAAHNRWKDGYMVIIEDYPENMDSLMKLGDR